MKKRLFISLMVVVLTVIAFAVQYGGSTGK